MDCQSVRQTSNKEWKQNRQTTRLTGVQSARSNRSTTSNQARNRLRHRQDKHKQSGHPLHRQAERTFLETGRQWWTYRLNNTYYTWPDGATDQHLIEHGDPADRAIRLGERREIAMTCGYFFQPIFGLQTFSKSLLFRLRHDIVYRLV